MEAAADKININLSDATVAVCGATGDIGSAVCRWLTEKTDIKNLILVARNQERINLLQEELGRGISMPLEAALPKADIVVWVASLAKGG